MLLPSYSMLDFTDVAGQTLSDNLKRVNSLQVNAPLTLQPNPRSKTSLQWSLLALAQTPGGGESGYFFRTYRRPTPSTP